MAWFYPTVAVITLSLAVIVLYAIGKYVLFLWRDTDCGKTARQRYWAAAAIFILVSGYYLLSTSYAVVQGKRSPAWPTVKGQILRSEVKSWKYSKSTPHFYYDITYQYNVNGVQYTSNHFAFEDSNGISNSYIAGKNNEAIQDIAKIRYPIGSQITVSYDPKWPSQAVLQPGYHLLPLLFILPLQCIGMLIGLLMMRSAILSERRKGTARRSS